MDGLKTENIAGLAACFVCQTGQIVTIVLVASTDEWSPFFAIVSNIAAHRC